jgi:hypothetical protein
MDQTTVAIVGVALTAFGALGVIYAVNATRHANKENSVRDIAAEQQHQERGTWIGYRRDARGRLKASTTSRTVPAAAALSDPDPVRRAKRWLHKHFSPRI